MNVLCGMGLFQICFFLFLESGIIGYVGYKILKYRMFCLLLANSLTFLLPFDCKVTNKFNSDTYYLFSSCLF